MLDKRSLKNITEHEKTIICDENFAYLSPSEPLRNLISNFTICFPNKLMISDHYTIMPHGSVTLVLFNNNTGLHSLLFGPTTNTHKVGNIANTCEVIFIIEFQPAGFFPFTEIKQIELKDNVVSLSSIDSPLDQTIKDIFRNSSSVDELLIALEKELILSIKLLYPEELAAAIEVIIQKKGAVTALEISDKVFYCPRHLNRLFNLYLGMSMKTFSRLVRINKAVKLLNEREHTLDFICEELGFYDISHLVKDFKIVCGITPQEYRTNMSDFYSELAKF